jgi:CheY-like chemotaxis protein
MPHEAAMIVGYADEPRTLMVVDDIAEHTRLLAMLLQQVGFTTLEADGCDSALNTMNATVDLVITDQFMTDGTGWEVLARIKAGYPNVPVMLLSAALPQRPAGYPATLDFDACLTKPALAEDLFACIGKQLNLSWYYASVPETTPLTSPGIILPQLLTQTLIEMIDTGAITDILIWCDTTAASHPELQDSLNTVKTLALQLDFDTLRKRLGG